MKNSIRNSGIDTIGSVPWGTHLCQFYQNREELKDILIPYLKAGLESNELCMWITPDHLEAKEAKEILKKAIPDIDAYIRKKQIEIIPCNRWYLKGSAFDFQRVLNGLIEKVNESLTSGYEGLRLIENTCWLEKGNWKSFVNYEREVYSIINKYPIIALCTYSLDTCSPADILEIAANHQFVLVKKEGRWEKTENSGRKTPAECRQAEKKLQESEERYRMLFTNMTEGFYLAEAICNKDGKPYDYRYLEINPAYELIMGVKKEQILGKSILEVFPNASSTGIEKLCEVALSGQSVHFEMFSQVLDKYLDIYAFSPGKGKLAAIFRDITERKKLEEQARQRVEEMEAIMEVAPVAIWIGHDPQSQNITGNRMANELYEAKTGDNLSANVIPVRRFFRNSYELTTDELPMQQAALKNINVYDVEIDVLLPSGKLRTLLGSASPLHDAKGHVRGSVGAFMDITERKQAEEALRKSEESYRMLFINMTDGFSLLDVIYEKNGKPCDYRYLELNPAFELSLDVKREQVLGKTMLEVFPNVSQIAMEKYSEVAISGKPAHFEIFSHITHKYLDVYAFSPEQGKLALILRDITEPRQMEKELQESEKKYRNIVETASEGIWIGDSEARTVYVNKRLAEILGYTQDEMIGRMAWDFVDEEDKPIIKKNLEERRQGIDKNYEFKFIRKDGSPFWTIVSGKALFGNSGKFIGNMVMLTDITERKEAEVKLKNTLDNLEYLVKERTAELEKAYNSLKESEKGLAEAQKMAHVGNWKWDIAADKAYWSDELYRIFKRNPREPAPPYKEFLNYIHPDDRDLVDNATKKAMNGEPYSIEYRIVLANGEERVIHMQAEVNFDEKNVPAQIRGILQDITEYKRMEDALRQNEELLSAFLEQLPVGTGLFDPQGRLLVTNSILRRFISNVIPSKDPENSWRWRAWGTNGRLLEQSEWPGQRALRGESVTFGTDFLYTFDNGREIWIRVSSVPFRDRAGKIKGVIAVIQDIDEQKRNQEALQKIEKFRIKEIHHRIKNNLQVVSSLLDLQAETFSHLKVCKTPEVIEAFMESRNRVISMALIHEELYKGDKIDTLDFAAYLKKLTTDLLGSYNLGNKDISFKLDLEQVYLGMDTAIPLGIIVNELVSNSFKHAFSAGGKGKIQINLYRIETSAFKNNVSGLDKECMKKTDFDYVLEVSDNGKGIPQEINFPSADSLGLQLVTILVEQIDGCINLERDHGTKFTIWFSDIDK